MSSLLMHLAAAGVVSAPTDAYFKNVTLLLHGDGTNGGQNNTFLDSSTNNFTITRAGNTTQGSFSPYGSLWSNYALDTSTNNGLSWTFNGSPAQTAVGGTNYTIEFWVNRATRSGSYQCMFSTEGDRNNFIVNPSDNLLITSNGGTSMFTVAANTYVPVGVWTHVALVCSGTTWTLYFNGVSYGTYSGASKTNGPNGNAWLVGRNDMNGCGYLSNFRISTVARYSGNFTPSTTPFTADGSTAMLACQSNRFLDTSSNAQALTVNGTISVTNFAPFNPTAAYSTATNGGSGYFDGSGDSLSAPDNTALEMGSSDFTMEAWLYPNDSGWQTILTKSADTATAEFQFYAYNNAVNFFGSAGSTWNVGFYTGAVLVPKAWNHVAVTRSGSNWTIWVNGVSQATATASFTISNNTSPVVVGAFTNGVNYATGYLTDVRIVKGTAVYTSAFTPPTAPLTAITNTSLLLNFTNAAIFDNAMMNDLETVGNAQISTSVKKYGTGSLAFDGSGDYLCDYANPLNYAFGTGDFTVEAWVNFNSTSGTQGIADSENTTGTLTQPDRWYFIKDASGNLAFGRHNVGVVVSGAWAPATGTWYHVAACRSGSTLRVFVNGVQVGSAGDSTNFLSDGLQVGVAATPVYLNGYIDDLRITKGVARYTANFTPPTAAFLDQ